CKPKLEMGLAQISANTAIVCSMRRFPRGAAARVHRSNWKSSMKTFRGTYTVMITPFTPAGDVDAEALRDFVDWQIEQGIHGLIPLGSTGEFLSLDDDEKVLVAETV